MNQSDNTNENDQSNTGWGSAQEEPAQPIKPSPAGMPRGNQGSPYPTSGQPHSPLYQPYQAPSDQEQAYLGQSAPQAQPGPSQYDPQPTYPAWPTTSGQAQPSYQGQEYYQGQPYGQNQPPYQSQAPYGQQSAYQEKPTYQQPGFQQYPQGAQIPQAPASPGGLPYAYNGLPPINAPWYGIDFPNACKRYFIKFSIFSGRASRSEFWWAFLMTFLIEIAVSFIGSVLGDRAGQGLVGLVDLILLIPNLAVATRRLHDTDMSGLWLLLPWGCKILGTGIIVSGLFATLGYSFGTGGSLIIFGGMVAIAGIIAEIIFMVRPSDPRGRRYDR